MSKSNFHNARNSRQTIRQNPTIFTRLSSVNNIMDHVENKLAFRAQLYFYSFIAIALSLLLLAICHFYLPLLAAGLSLVAVAATCVFAALVVLWFDRRISNSVRMELKALNKELEQLHLEFTRILNNETASNKDLYAHMYLEAGMTLLFQSQAIPNKKGENLMESGYNHLKNLVLSCQQKEEQYLNCAQMHELYKVLSGHSKAVVGLADGTYNTYKKRMNFYGALKQYEAHQNKIDIYNKAPTSTMGRWLKTLKIWRKITLPYHKYQVDTMRAETLKIASDMTDNEKTLLIKRLTNDLINGNNNSAESVFSGSTAKSVFATIGSTMSTFDEGMDYLKHGFVNRIFHEISCLDKGFNGATELLTPGKYGRYQSK